MKKSICSWPTNHLDVASREWIECALEDYEGTLIFVSHDRYFVDKFATRIWELSDGTIRDFPCGYAKYRAILEHEAAARQRPAQPKKEKQAKPVSGSKELEKLVRRLEREIAAKEDEAAQLEQALAGAASDYQELLRLTAEKERCEAELEQIEYAGDTLARLAGELTAAEKVARQAAQALSEARKTAAERLSAQILEELRQLDMGKIRFAVDFAEKPLDSDGADTVRFLMSANVGEELRPIHKIASGGELARIMLAMKNVLSEQDKVSTLVFDEVDTGVSGRAAQKVAEKMARISRSKQVLCVTHLPQLAAMADTHFSVEKGERDGRTYTEVRRLDREQRRQELARLTGGSHVSQTMLDGAEELLAQAEAFRQGL